MDTTIHDRIKIARTQRGLSVREAATDAGVTRQAWWSWEERGATPTGDRLVRAAKTLRVGLDYLVGAP